MQWLIAGCNDTLTVSQDRALLLVFAGALRQSEPVALERDHLTIDAAGAHWRARGSPGG